MPFEILSFTNSHPHHLRIDKWAFEDTGEKGESSNALLQTEIFTVKLVKDYA